MFYSIIRPNYWVYFTLIVQGEGLMADSACNFYGYFSMKKWCWIVWFLVIYKVQDESFSIQEPRTICVLIIGVFHLLVSLFVRTKDLDHFFLTLL